MTNAVKNQEAIDQAVIGATRQLHEGGEEQIHSLDIARKVTLNDEAYMRRRKIAGKVLGFIGFKLDTEPIKFSVLGDVTSSVARLVSEGRLEAEWEAPVLQLDGHPQGRLIRLIEEPDTQAA